MSVEYTTAKKIQVLTGHKKGHVSGLATASEGVLKHHKEITAQNGENVKRKAPRTRLSLLSSNQKDTNLQSFMSTIASPPFFNLHII